MRPTDFTVSSYSELEEALQKITARNEGALILLRGQRRLHDSVRSGRGRPAYSPSPLVETGWTAFASSLFGINSTSELDGVIQAVLQHYGYETYFLDLTSRLDIAAWFASHDYSSQMQMFLGNQFRRTEVVSYSKTTSGDGYIVVMAFEDPEALKLKNRLVDLSCLPSSFERPLRQGGWLILDRPPTRPLPDDFVVGVIKINLERFDIPNAIEPFPNGNEDPAFAKMRELPFVQFDTYDEEKANAENPTGHQLACAVRILNLPEYGQEEDQKWNDVTIYEPLSVREWRIWHAELGQLYPGAVGDIAKTKKITISPGSMKALEESSESALSWPNLSSDGLFCSFAALDHDKVIEHAPPYEGVWLQRSGSLIIETPTNSDEKTLAVGRGHAYFLNGQSLEQQEMEGACDCENRQSHELRVKSILRIQALVSCGELILLPHPYHGEDWFFIFKADERQMLANKISSFKRVHRMIMKDLAENNIPRRA
jgi:hypothetical protein